MVVHPHEIRTGCVNEKRGHPQFEMTGAAGQRNGSQWKPKNKKKNRKKKQKNKTERRCIRRNWTMDARNVAEGTEPPPETHDKNQLNKRTVEKPKAAGRSGNSAAFRPEERKKSGRYLYSLELDPPPHVRRCNEANRITAGSCPKCSTRTEGGDGRGGGGTGWNGVEGGGGG